VYIVHTSLWLRPVSDNSVMTMEALASVHVFITSTLRMFVNRLVTYRVSTSVDLSHLQGCSAATYSKRYFGHALSIQVSALSPLYILRSNCSKSFRPEPFFRPKTTSIGHIVTEAWCNSAYVIHHKSDSSPPRSYVNRRDEMNILIIALALFGGKSS
jgi:hypothetical protein